MLRARGLRHTAFSRACHVDVLRRLMPLELLQSIVHREAVAGGHADIQEDNIGMHPTCLLHCHVAVLRGMHLESCRGKPR